MILAQRQGIYAKRGLDVTLLPPPIPGAEPGLVTSMQEALTDEETLVLGCVEENTLIAAQLYACQPIRALSAMLHSTPLAIATAPGRGINSLHDLAGKSVAAADDTEEIVRNALEQVDPSLRESVTIVPMPREEKLIRFRSGEVDAMQVYSTTEALQLEKDLALHLDQGQSPVLLFPFGGRHGYAQVIYAHEKALQIPRHRNVARAFLDATYEGWSRALSHPQAAAELVALAREEAGVRGVEGEYSDTYEFHLKSLEALGEFIVPSTGYQMGTIELGRFMEAADVIAADLTEQTHFIVPPHHQGSGSSCSPAPWDKKSLLLPYNLIDTSLWPPPELLRWSNYSTNVHIW